MFVSNTLNSRKTAFWGLKIASVLIFSILVAVFYVVSIQSRPMTLARSSNEDFLDSSFWTSNPTTGQIINALFWDGTGWSDSTIYTQYRTGNFCNTNSMNVAFITGGLFTGWSLTGNMIYVFDSGSYSLFSPLSFSGCVAMVGSGDVTFGFTWAIIGNITGVQNVIIDGIDFLGDSNQNGLFIHNSTWFTLHDIQAKNSAWSLFVVSQSHYGFFHTMTWDNAGLRPFYFQDWSSHNRLENIVAKNASSLGAITFDPWNYNYLSGIEISNSPNGLHLRWWSSYNTILHLRSHDNSNYWLTMSSGPSTGNRIEDVEVFNHAGSFDWWIEIEAVENDLVLKNVKSYNNFFGIAFYLSQRNILSDLQLYNNTYGVYLWAWSTPSLRDWAIINSKIYGNTYGIYSENTTNGSIHNSLLHNVLIYDNQTGVYMTYSSGNVFANTQIFKNTVWVDINNSQNNLRDRSQVYANSNQWVLLRGTTTTQQFNNTRIYNNGTWISVESPSSWHLYFWTVRLFANSWDFEGTNWVDVALTGGTSAPVGSWSGGMLITWGVDFSGTKSCDYATVPFNSTNTHLYTSLADCSLRWRDAWWALNSWVRYVFFPWIFKQTQPIVFTWGAFTTSNYMYHSWMFIGDVPVGYTGISLTDPLPFGGSFNLLSNYPYMTALSWGRMLLNSTSTVLYQFMVTKTATYNLTGDIALWLPTLVGTIGWVQTGSFSFLTGSTGEKFASVYFTGSESNIYALYAEYAGLPITVLRQSPADAATFTTAQSVTLVASWYDGLWWGLKSYFFQVSTGADMVVLYQTGLTSNFGTSLSLWTLPVGTYYRRLTGQNIMGDTTGFTSTGYFTVTQAPAWWGGGWGWSVGWGWWGGGGPVVDNCPNGDLSPSYYDGDCWGQVVHTSAPVKEFLAEAQPGQLCKYADEPYSKIIFQDTQKSSYRNAVDLLRVNCVVKGVASSEFGPTQRAKIWEFIKVLTKIWWVKNDFDLSQDPTWISTSKVVIPPNHWSSLYLKKADELWILDVVTKRNWVGLNVVYPEDSIKRKEAVKLVMGVYRLLHWWDTSATRPVPFVDVTNKKWLFYSSIYQAYKLWIIKWTSVNGKLYFDPDAYLTRQDMAKLVTQAFSDILTVPLTLK